MVKKTFEILNGFNIIDKLSIIEYMKIDRESQLKNAVLKILQDAVPEVNGCEYDDVLNLVQIKKRNDYFKIPSGIVAKILEKYYELGSFGYHLNEEYMIGYDHYTIFTTHMSGCDIFEYAGIEPFSPSVMINISPDWKCLSDRTSPARRIKILEGLINNYMLEGERYDKYSYAIENGADGDNIHAHVVAHINPKLIKSVETHLGKGTHRYQIAKYAKKLNLMGADGLIKGASVQKTFLRNSKLVEDKLDYLIEDKKPLGHKNASIITDRIDKVLFTVKY